MHLASLLKIIDQNVKICLANPDHGPSMAIHNVIRAIIAAMPAGEKKEVARRLYEFMSVVDLTLCPHHMAVRLLKALAPIIASARASKEKEVQGVIPGLLQLEAHVLQVRDREPSCHDVKHLDDDFVAAITAYRIVYGETEQLRQFLAYMVERMDPSQAHGPVTLVFAYIASQKSQDQIIILFFIYYILSIFYKN
jgi:hypothetical protein